MNNTMRIAAVLAVCAATLPYASAGQCGNVQEALPSGAGHVDASEYGVVVHGDVAMIGARGEECLAGDGCGAVYVFGLTEAGWVEQQKLTASDAAADDEFGDAVAFDGNRVLIGAALDDCAAGDTCGAAYIFVHNGTSWVEQQKLVASDAAAIDAFGRRVDIDGDVAVVSSTGVDCPAGDLCGAAYVYRYDGGTWVEEQKLIASDTDANDLFGIVAVDGDTILVGAWRDACADGDQCGAAYVFGYDGATWVEEQKLVSIDLESEDKFGWAVELENNTAVIGARSADFKGAVYVFEYDGSAWEQAQKFSVFDGSGNFGTSISLDEDRLLVGATTGPCDPWTNCGQAYLYERPGFGEWFAQLQLLTAPAEDADHQDFFGDAVSLHGPTILVGAHGDDCPGATNCGSAYFFSCSTPAIPAASTSTLIGLGLALALAGCAILRRRRFTDCRAA
jgi:hypothetical protein